MSPYLGIQHKGALKAGSGKKRSPHFRFIARSRCALYLGYPQKVTNPLEVS